MSMPEPSELWDRLEAQNVGFSESEIATMWDLLSDPSQQMTDDERYNRMIQLTIEDAGTKENQIAGEIRTPDYARNGSVWAPLTQVPTTTSDPDRPRTIGAGYDVTRYILTVQFRDNTLYNYYDVPPHIWDQFRGSPSKGKYMQRELDQWPEKGPVSGHSEKYYAGKARKARAAQTKMYKPIEGLN
jgi:hypothetical protein